MAPKPYLVEKYRLLLNQLSPRGDAIPKEINSNWQKWFVAMATVFATVHEYIEAIVIEWFPMNTLTRFNDWEKLTQGIDDCQLVTNTIAERRARILAKLRMTAGGMDGKNGSAAAIAYLESIAASLGYDVTITKSATATLDITINSFDGGVACTPRHYGAPYGEPYADCGYALLQCILERYARASYVLNFTWDF